MDYLLIGPVTADRVHGERLLGGTVSYAAPVVSRIGHTVRIVTSIAQNEPLIAPILPYCELHNVPSPYTTTFENRYIDGYRQQILHHVGHTVTANDLPTGWQNAKLVHLAPLANDVDRAIVDAFTDATIMLTPQGYMRQWDEAGNVTFKQFNDPMLLSKIDILVLSRDDIAQAPELEKQYSEQVRHLVVTDGLNGGYYYHNGTVHHYRAYPAEETDPTGAGDVFAASLLASLPLLKNDMHKALTVASQLAACAVTVKGVMTDPPIDIPTLIREAQQ
ncbi:MAG: PfkB family carbohydrate kinase [Chloroflexota bacterium]